ncbi:MAG: hypothetical protein EXR76_18030 [Myxococcales bacterium]|nr:hypothetical protein [Myxococcales bacterium]
MSSDRVLAVDPDLTDVALSNLDRPGALTLSVPPPPDAQAWWVDQQYALYALILGVGILFATLTLRSREVDLRQALRRLRVLLLVGLLAGVLIYAQDLVGRREARRDWSRSLHVAVIFLEEHSQAAVPQDVMDRLFARALRASDLLAAEKLRYIQSEHRPFWFHPLGPVGVEVAPPLPPPEGNLWEMFRYRFAVRRYLAAVHTDGDLRPERYDVRLYVTVRPSTRSDQKRFVEGMAEQGGEIGFVSAVIDESMIDRAWITIAHEALHAVGALDKYDAGGHHQDEGGLVEPERSPQYPQRYAEIMVGEIPLDEGVGRVPDLLRQVRVGEVTAREIGWR